MAYKSASKMRMGRSIRRRPVRRKPIRGKPVRRKPVRRRRPFQGRPRTKPGRGGRAVVKNLQLLRPRRGGRPRPRRGGRPNRQIAKRKVMAKAYSARNNSRNRGRTAGGRTMRPAARIRMNFRR